MFEALFVISAVICINWLFMATTVVVHNTPPHFPIPFLHRWKITVGSSYVSFPSMSYQIYFWASFYGVI